MDVTVKYMTDGFEPPAAEGWQSFYLIHNYTKTVRPHPQNFVNEDAPECIENALIWTV